MVSSGKTASLSLEHLQSRAALKFFSNFFAPVWQTGTATSLSWVVGGEGLAAGDAEPQLLPQTEPHSSGLDMMFEPQTSLGSRKICPSSYEHLCAIPDTPGRSWSSDTSWWPSVALPTVPCSPQCQIQPSPLPTQPSPFILPPPVPTLPSSPICRHHFTCPSWGGMQKYSRGVLEHLPILYAPPGAGSTPAPR